MRLNFVVSPVVQISSPGCLRRGGRLGRRAGQIPPCVGPRGNAGAAGTDEGQPAGSGGKKGLHNCCLERIHIIDAE